MFLVVVVGDGLVVGLKFMVDDRMQGLHVEGLWVMKGREVMGLRDGVEGLGVERGWHGEDGLVRLGVRHDGVQGLRMEEGLGVEGGLRDVLGRRGDIDRLGGGVGDEDRLGRGRVVGRRRRRDGLLYVGLGRGVIGLGGGGVGRGLVGCVGRVVGGGDRVVGVVRLGVVGLPGLGGELVGDGAEVLGEGRGRQQGRDYLETEQNFS